MKKFAALLLLSSLMLFGCGSNNSSTVSSNEPVSSSKEERNATQEEIKELIHKAIEQTEEIRLLSEKEFEKREPATIDCYMTGEIIYQANVNDRGEVTYDKGEGELHFRYKRYVSQVGGLYRYENQMISAVIDNKDVSQYEHIKRYLEGYNPLNCNYFSGMFNQLNIYFEILSESEYTNQEYLDYYYISEQFVFSSSSKAKIEKNGDFYKATLGDRVIPGLRKLYVTGFNSMFNCYLHDDSLLMVETKDCLRIEIKNKSGENIAMEYSKEGTLREYIQDKLKIVWKVV